MTDMTILISKNIKNTIHFSLFKLYAIIYKDIICKELINHGQGSSHHSFFFFY